MSDGSIPHRPRWPSWASASSRRYERYRSVATCRSSTRHLDRLIAAIGASPGAALRRFSGLIKAAAASVAAIRRSALVTGNTGHAINTPPRS